jgi:hypothetical protein
MSLEHVLELSVDQAAVDAPFWFLLFPFLPHKMNLPRRYCLHPLPLVVESWV